MSEPAHAAMTAASGMHGAAPASSHLDQSEASPGSEAALDGPIAASGTAASSVAADSEPTVEPNVSDDVQSVPSVTSQTSVSPAPASVTHEPVSLKPAVSTAKPSARRSANPALLSGSTAANRSALLSAGRSSIFVSRNRASDLAKPTATAATANASAKPKPKPAATAAATLVVRAKPAAAAATRKPLAAAAAAASSAPKPSARPPSARRLSATPRKPIVLAQPPPSHSAARGNRRVPQPPEPPGYSGLLYSHVLGVIFSYLEFASLRSAVQVSPSWRSAVGAMRPIASAKFKFVHPLKKHMQLNEFSPLSKHVSQVGRNDPASGSQELNLALLMPIARCFTHVTTMNIKLGSSAWLSKATQETFPFPPSLTALGFTFERVSQDKLPPEPMIKQVTQQLLASIAALPLLSRLYLMLHWRPTLDLSALQAPHDRGSLRHLTLDLYIRDPLSSNQISVLRSLTQLESLVLLRVEWGDHHRMLLALPHPPFAWQRIMELRDLSQDECMKLIPPLTELRELDVGHIALGLSALHSLPHLTRLAITAQFNAAYEPAQCHVLTAGLAGCVHLTALKIRLAQVSSAQLAEILAPMSKLTELSLFHLMHLESYEWATRGPITQTLRTLSIERGRWLPLGGFQQLRALSALRRLQLDILLHWNGAGGMTEEEIQAATPPSTYWPMLRSFRYQEERE